VSDLCAAGRTLYIRGTLDQAGSTIRFRSKSITAPTLAMKSVPISAAACDGSVQTRNECWNSRPFSTNETNCCPLI
jgi:hypothetical protein